MSKFQHDVMLRVVKILNVRHSKLPVNADTTEYTYEAIGP